MICVILFRHIRFQFTKISFIVAKIDMQRPDDREQKIFAMNSCTHKALHDNSFCLLKQNIIWKTIQSIFIHSINHQVQIDLSKLNSVNFLTYKSTSVQLLIAFIRIIVPSFGSWSSCSLFAERALQQPTFLQQ